MHRSSRHLGCRAFHACGPESVDPFHGQWGHPSLPILCLCTTGSWFLHDPMLDHVGFPASGLRQRQRRLRLPASSVLLRTPSTSVLIAPYGLVQGSAQHHARTDIGNSFDRKCCSVFIYMKYCNFNAKVDLCITLMLLVHELTSACNASLLEVPLGKNHR